jgi:uncharacterized protein
MPRRFSAEVACNRPKDIEAADAIVRRIAGRRGSPVGHLELLLTLDCNHRCDYCFVHDKRKGNDMPHEVARRAIDFLLTESARMSTVSILPFGGEPLLRFDLMQEIVEYAAYAASVQNPPKTATFSLTTNGTLVDEEKMAFFRNHAIMVLLSIDGCQRTHDRHRSMEDGCSSYEAIVSRLPMIRRYQPWLGTRMTVHPDGATNLYDDFEHLVSLGINQFLVGPATGIAWSAAQWGSYEDQMVLVIHRYAQLRHEGRPVRVAMFERRMDQVPGALRGTWGCGAGRGRMAVAPDGGLYPCSKVLGIDALRETHRLGDVWSGITDYCARGDLFLADEERRPKCKTCELKDDCAGGCPATNYEENGDMFQPAWLDCAHTRLMLRLRRELDSIGEIEPMQPRSLKHIRPIG